MRAAAPLLLAIATPLAAQAAPPQAAVQPVPTLDFMIGDWTGEGMLFGRSSRVALNVEPALGGKGVLLDYRVEAAAQGAQPGFAFAGHAIYRVATKGRWEGRWLDSGGMFRELSGEVAAGRMTVTWGSAATEIGRTVYALEGETLVLTDEVLRASGRFETFATARLIRK